MAKTDITYRATLDPQGIKEGANAVKGEFKKLNDSFEGVAAACKKYNDTMAKGSTGNLRKELRATLQAAASLENEYRKLSAAEKASAQGQELRAKIDELIQRGGQLKDTMGDVNSAITRVASDTAQIDAAVGALGALNAVAQVGVGVFSMLGVEEGKLAQVQKDLMAVIAIGNGLQTIQNALQKESAVMMWANAVKTSVLTAATKGDTIIQTAWNVAKAVGKALLGDFTGLLIVGAGALATYSIATSGSSEELEENSKSAENAKKKNEEFYKSVADGCAKNIASLVRLTAEWKNLRTAQQKNEFIQKNRKEIEKFTGATNDLAKAFDGLVKNSGKIVDALIQIGVANAYAALIEEEAGNYVRKKLALQTYKYKKWNAGDNANSGIIKDAGLGEGDYKRVDFGFGRTKAVFTEAGAAKATAYEMRKSQKDNLDERKKVEDNFTKKMGNLIGKMNEAQKKGDAVIPREHTAATSARTTSTSSNNAKNYTKGSIGYIDKQISTLNEKLKSTTSDAVRIAITKQIKALEAQKVEIQFVAENGITMAEGIKKMLKPALEQDFELTSLEPPAIDPEKIKEGMRQVAAIIKAGTAEWQREIDEIKADTLNNAIYNLANSFSSLGTIIGGVAGQMVSWAAQSAASIAQMLAENAQLIISAQAVAMANGAKSAFALPFPFNLAAWATVAATIAGIFASLPKFATGGIVSGSGYSGDRQLIRANSGEMVITRAQQARLWSAISGGGSLGGGQVTFKISGQELHGVLRNYNNKINRAR